MRFQIIFILLFIFFQSCSFNKPSTENQKEIVLPGKIVAYTLNAGDSCLIYDNSNSSKISFKVDRFSDHYIDGYTWMNTTDSFIATEYNDSIINDRPSTKGKLVKTDVYGNVNDCIYKAKYGEVAANGYLTRNDSLLLFTITTEGDFKKNPLEGLMRMNSICVMNFKTKGIIREVDSVGPIPMFSIYESPWLYDNNRFIYTINYENGIVDKNYKNLEVESPGIYMCNLNNNDKPKLLIANGSFGICSPVEMKIAYKKNQSIYCYNINDKSTKLIYKARIKEKVANMHWTPDGKYIYIVNYALWSTEEKLIDIKTGKEISFKKIHQGYYPYSWK